MEKERGDDGGEKENLKRGTMLRIYQPFSNIPNSLNPILIGSLENKNDLCGFSGDYGLSQLGSS